MLFKNLLFLLLCKSKKSQHICRSSCSMKCCNNFIPSSSSASQNNTPEISKDIYQDDKLS